MTVESPFMLAQKLPSVLRVSEMKMFNDFKGCMVAEEGLEPPTLDLMPRYYSPQKAPANKVLSLKGR